MVTLPIHTSYALQPLDVDTYFKPFKTSFRKKNIYAMAKNNYLEPHKITLTWVDKALQKSLKKENTKSRCKVYGIWPLNPTTMVGKFGPNDVFIVAKEEEHELSYYLNATNECRIVRLKLSQNLLNIAMTFQAKLQTIPNYPPSPCHITKVEMSNSSSTTINNHDEDQLVVDLEDVTLESKDLIGSNQSEGVGWAHLLLVLGLPTKKKQSNKPLMDYSNSSGNIIPIFGYSKIEGCEQKNYK